MWVYFVASLCLFIPAITDHVDGRGSGVDFNAVFPSWSSNHHAAQMTVQKRQAEVAAPKPGQTLTAPLHNETQTKNPKVDGKRILEQVSEGDVESKVMPETPTTPITKVHDAPPNNITVKQTKQGEPSSVSGLSVNINENVNKTVKNSTSTIKATTQTKVDNSTAPKVPYETDLSNPGVMKRGLIVFGAFSLMAVAYFIFYRRKNKNNDSNNGHGTNDTNQFRYGVLQSDERRDNLELSRIPLTMESDEDEDEDLEIFDLEQKKKSLSYVNLQTSDEYIVHAPRESEIDRDNLLLDIEDASSDQLINWSNNGNKSIL